MREGSITHSARRLNITQPAVSNAVARMREIWNDELFVKEGRGIKPTIYAENLWANIKGPLKNIEDAVSPSVFLPENSNRVFRIAATDLMVDVLWTKLRRRVQEKAPDVSIHTIPYTIENGTRLLTNAAVDILIGADDQMPTIETSASLMALEYVCAMRADHPFSDGRMTLKKFLQADHLLVSLSGDLSGYTDRALAERGHVRKIAMSINNFASAPNLIANSDLISVLPYTTVMHAVEKGQIIVRSLPLDVPGPKLSIFWHQRAQLDPGHIWLRETLRELALESS